jgi:hypothetical protein
MGGELSARQRDERDGRALAAQFENGDASRRGQARTPGIHEDGAVDDLHDRLMPAAVDHHVRAGHTVVVGIRLCTEYRDARVASLHDERPIDEPWRLCRWIGVPPDRSHRRHRFQLIKHAQRPQIAAEQHEVHAVERASNRGLQRCPVHLLVVRVGDETNPRHGLETLSRHWLPLPRRTHDQPLSSA